MPRPRLIALDKADVIERQVVVDGTDDRPVDGGGNPAGGIVAVDVPRHFIVGKLFIEVGFAVPEGLSQR